MDTCSDPRRTAAWAKLEKHACDIGQQSLRELLSSNHLADVTSIQARFADLSVTLDDLCADFSRTRVTPATIGLLVDLATEMRLDQFIDALFSGALVNNTEARPALHTGLRSDKPSGPEVDGVDIAALVAAERQRYLEFADAVRQGRRAGSSGQPFETVINIGIGGSDLGPRFVSGALADADQHSIAVHFVAGLDGMELRAALTNADPATTLFVVCSKTFTTLETLSNAHAARAWLIEKIPGEKTAQHFAAVSVNHQAMDQFGVASDARFAMWDWVGGRYSVWSPIGVSAAIAIGVDAYREFLGGASCMDQHFRTASAEQNIPVLHGLIAIWHQNFLGLDQHVVLPYDQRLSCLPDYLQQLWMESLGKTVRRDGQPVDYPTGASLWGSNGSSAQHSFAQWLHQGSAKAAVDYIGTANGAHPADAEAHLASLANMLAQAEVLALGQPAAAGDDSLGKHREHPGNRPSTLLLLKSLTPRALGMLLALYEHSVYVQSVIWGINPFDQFGVERGKQVAHEYTEVLLQKDESKLPALARQILEWRESKS